MLTRDTTALEEVGSPKSVTKWPKSVRNLATSFSIRKSEMKKAEADFRNYSKRQEKQVTGKIANE